MTHQRTHGRIRCTRRQHYVRVSVYVCVCVVCVCVCVCMRARLLSIGNEGRSAKLHDRGRGKPNNKSGLQIMASFKDHCSTPKTQFSRSASQTDGARRAERQTRTDRQTNRHHHQTIGPWTTLRSPPKPCRPPPPIQHALSCRATRFPHRTRSRAPLFLVIMMLLLVPPPPPPRRCLLLLLPCHRAAGAGVPWLQLMLLQPPQLLRPPSFPAQSPRPEPCRASCGQAATCVTACWPVALARPPPLPLPPGDCPPLALLWRTQVSLPRLRHPPRTPTSLP